MGKLILVTLLIIQSAVFAADLAVSPLMIETEVNAGSEQSFNFNILAKSDATVRLSVFDLQQQLTGHMDFVESLGADANDAISWLSLEKEKFTLKAGESLNVVGRIKMPRRISGNRMAAVMVEEIKPSQTQGGIQVKVRYAVILNVQVQGPQVRSVIRTKFDNMRMVEIEGSVFIEGYFENLSNVESWLMSEVQIRSESKKLLERVTLKTESAWQRSDDGSRVFPKMKVRVFGKVNKAMSGDLFSLIVRNKFAGKMQPVVRKDLSIQSIESLEATVKVKLESETANL